MSTDLQRTRIVVTFQRFASLETVKDTIVLTILVSLWSVYVVYGSEWRFTVKEGVQANEDTNLE